MVFKRILKYCELGIEQMLANFKASGLIPGHVVHMSKSHDNSRLPLYDTKHFLDMTEIKTV